MTAGAGKRQIYERSAGKTHALLPPSSGYWPSLAGVSADAAHVFVTTNLALAPEDTDGAGVDLLDVSAGGAALISTGPLDAQSGGGEMASFQGSSPDGGRVFFDAAPALTPDDLDRCPDLYQRSGVQTTLVAPDPAPPAPPVCRSVEFGGVSADGSHLFFSSGADLEPGDERGEDIYQQVGGVFTRLTTYPEPEGPCVDLVSFADASRDGGTVLFSTNVQVVAEDIDAAADVYKRRPDGTFALVSRGTEGGSQPCGPFGGDRPVALSADGSTAVFETASRLSPSDTDSSNDLYSADDSGVVELLSTGPTDANLDERSPVFPDWLALASDDARRVAFETRQSLLAADGDATADVYLRAGGQTALISSRPVGKAASRGAELLAFSGDGSTVVLATPEQLSEKDTDHGPDVYLWRVDRPRPQLISGETIAPRMRIAAHGRVPRSGQVEIRLLCPKSETSGPCHGRLVLKRGGRGPRYGAARFRVEAGRRGRVKVRLRPRFRAHPPAAAVVRVRGADALGNARLVLRRVSLRR